jgi:hypothetical protein
MELDSQKLIDIIKEKHPKVLSRNKHFWRSEFGPIFHDFVKSSVKRYDVVEEIDPFKINRCPACKVAIIPHDNYCSNCGAELNWS